MCCAISGNPQESHIGWTSPENRYKCVKWQSQLSLAITTESRPEIILVHINIQHSQFANQIKTKYVANNLHRKGGLQSQLKSTLKLSYYTVVKQKKIQVYSQLEKRW